MIRLVEFLQRLWRRHAGAISWVAPALILLVGVLAALWITVGAGPEPGPGAVFPTALAQLPAAGSGAGESGVDVPGAGGVPPAALSATLWDELFPPPPAPPPPAPPLKLDLDLVAIIATPAENADADGSEESARTVTRRAVVFDKARAELVELSVGQSLPGRERIVLTSLSERAATFELDGRTVTLELKP